MQDIIQNCFSLHFANVFIIKLKTLKTKKPLKRTKGDKNKNVKANHGSVS